jgi:hypothetical protein
MDKHPIVFLLLVLTFPIWPVFWYWLLFGFFAKRKTAPWVFLLAGLASVALAVAFFVIFSQWLEDPQTAEVAAVIYGSPAFFFILIGVSNWWLRGCHGQQVPGSQVGVGRQDSSETEEHLREGRQGTS